MNVSVGIATTGRREQLLLTLAQLARQTVSPYRVIVCPAADDDVDIVKVASVYANAEIIRGPRGSCAQRNTIIDACGDSDILLFIDDDYYPADDYIEALTELFSNRTDVVVATNTPLADGATGPGIEHSVALDILKNASNRKHQFIINKTYGGYGCNMTINVNIARARNIRFDETLPLYGWLEDIDFSRRLAPYGKVVSCSRLNGVHLGTKTGRTSGRRFGYSQVINPMYMWRKGSLSAAYAFKHIAKNVLKNVVFSLWPEPWVDRRGRLQGNALACVDLICGRLDPSRIINIQPR